MEDLLHPATRAIVDTTSAADALAQALALAASPPPGWISQQWLTIAAAADARSEEDPRWLAIRVVAFENYPDGSSRTDALRTRAALLTTLGDEPTDPFGSLSVFIARVEAFLGADDPDSALAGYRAGLSAIFSVPRDRPEWSAARDTFMRGRRLRELGGILATVIEAGLPLPTHLERWSEWAHLREEDGMVIKG